MPTGTPVPLVDLKAAHAEVEAEVRAGFDRVLATGGYLKGPEVAGFEEEYAGFSGTRHRVGAANGTDALELALRALGLPPGGVVLPASTFVATAEAVVRAGLRPVLVDADPAHPLIDPARAADARPGAVALLPVHLNGRLAPTAPLLEAADGLPVVERTPPSPRAPGSTAAPSTAGSPPPASTPARTSARTATRAPPSPTTTWPPPSGSSATTARAASTSTSGSASTPGWTPSRPWCCGPSCAGRPPGTTPAGRYHRLLAGLDGVTLPRTAPGNERVRHLYAVRIGPGRDRDTVLAALQAAGVGAAVHYPVPVRLQPAFRHLGHGEGAFPVAERAARELLTLPPFPQITEVQQERVAEALAKALAA